MSEEMKLDPNPESTWGANETYREAWNKEYSGVPAGNAPKAEWVERAVSAGLTQEEAEALTVAELKESYGADFVAPASTAPAAGGGVDSGTAEGTAPTAASPTTGTKGK